MERHYLKVTVGFLLAACLLTACGARTEQPPAPAPEEPAASEPAKTPAPEKAPWDMLPGLDAAALKDTMPEEDYEARIHRTLLSGKTAKGEIVPLFDWKC